MANLPVANGQTFFSEEWCSQNKTKNNSQAAIKFAEKIGFPVIVKPNARSQGEGVFKARDTKHLEKILRWLFRDNNIVIVEKYFTGQDCRVVVFNGKVFLAYVRIPFSVTGDGRSNLKQLIEGKISEMTSRGREIKTGPEDRRIKEHIKTFYRKTLSFIPKDGQKISLLDNANLSSGGSTKDVTDVLNENYKDVAIKTARELGLTFCGVDMLIDGEVSNPKNNFVILEANSSLGLTHFYLSGSKKERLAVEKIYSEILRFLYNQ
jgi:D-alanine-D-alanine ligase-like ATP-grasp enzyme